MRQPDDASLFVDILIAARDAREMAAGVTYDDLLEDRKLQLALVKLIEIMGEGRAASPTMHATRCRALPGARSPG